MRFIIFSDSHGSISNMREALRRNAGTGLDGIIFLGDGLKSAKQLADESGLELYAVAGNCDFGPDIDPTRLDTYEKLLDFDGVKVLITHGHKYMVKTNGEVINKYARSKGADVVLYGPADLLDGPLLEATREALAHQTLPFVAQRVHVRVVPLEDELVLKGAAAYVRYRELGVV